MIEENKKDSKEIEENSILSKRKIPEGFQDEDNNSIKSKVKTTEEIDPLRICIQGINKFTDEKDIIKFVNKNFKEEELKLIGVTKVKNKTWAFLAFETNEQRNYFEKKIKSDKIKFKNKKIKLRDVNSDVYSIKLEKKVEKIIQQVNQKNQKV